MPASPEGIVVPAALLRGVVARARAAGATEIVGLLSGPGPGVATRDVPLANVSGDRSTFVVDPFTQFLAEREIAARGEEIVAIYHSHPCGDAAFSHLDAHFARAWACAHLVIGLEPALETRAFRVEAAAIVELPIRVS
jgi:proteasome lid subunit RPN8/RPN11